MSSSNETQSGLVLTSTPTARVRVLTLNRPDKRNALSQALIKEFLHALSEANADPDVRVIVITGGASFFSAGADLKDTSTLDGESARRTRYLEDLCNGLRDVRKPVIAAVEGMALGGGFEVALMCDMILASRAAKFGFPEVKIGLIPGAGGTQRLTNTVGKYRAMEMILVGDPITAERADALGLVTGLCEPGAALGAALDLATRISGGSSSAVALAKEAICRADDLGRDDDFERSLYYAAFGTKDKIEGVSAFLEKRAPNWS